MATSDPNYVINTFKFYVGERGVWIGGPHTYQVKSDIKKCGGKWNSFRKQWYVTNEKLNELISLLLEKDFTLKLEENERMIYVSGFTYQYKTGLKELGGKWNKEKNAWAFDKALSSEITAFVTSVNEATVA